MQQASPVAAAPAAPARAAPYVVAALVAFTLVRGLIWAYLVPALDAPDEPSHLIAVAQMRAIHGLPVAIILDPNTVSENSTPRPAALREYLTRYGYTHFRALPYESTQPPLYYALCAALTAPLPDDPETLLYGCRFVSALLGALTVFAAARAAATLAPEWPAFALGVPLALALWPQFAFQTATVTNDIGLDLGGAALAWAWAAALRAPAAARWPVILGLLTGLGLLTKLTLGAGLAATAVVLLGRAWVAGGRAPAVRRLVVEAAVVGGLALALVGPWLWRNLRVYGEPTGAAQMFSVIHSIYTTRLHLPATTRFIPPPLGDFVWYSFTSFWSVFGWRGVFLPTPLYALAAALTALGVVGSAAWLVRRARGRPPLPAGTGWALAAYAVMALAAVTSYGLYTLTTDASLQGRYTFAALVPFCAIGVGGALRATGRPAVDRALGRLALLGLVILQVAAWTVIARH
jgi:hypothetical protein